MGFPSELDGLSALFELFLSSLTRFFRLSLSLSSLSRESVYPSVRFSKREHAACFKNVSSPHAVPLQQCTTIEWRIIKTGAAVILEREERERKREEGCRFMKFQLNFQRPGPLLDVIAA